MEGIRKAVHLGDSISDSETTGSKGSPMNVPPSRSASQGFAAFCGITRANAVGLAAGLHGPELQQAVAVQGAAHMSSTIKIWRKRMRMPPMRRRLKPSSEPCKPLMFPFPFDKARNAVRTRRLVCGDRAQSQSAT